MKIILSQKVITGTLVISALAALPLYFALANKAEPGKPAENSIDVNQATEALVKDLESTKSQSESDNVMMLDDGDSTATSAEIASNSDGALFEDKTDAAEEDIASNTPERTRDQTTTNVQRTLNSVQQTTTRRPRF